MNIAELLRQRGACAPTRPGLVFFEETDSFRDMADKASRLGAYLIERGVQRVGIAMPNAAVAVHALYGVLWAGCTAVMVNHTLSRSELDAALEDGDVDLLILSCGARDAWGEVGVPLLVEDQLVGVLSDSTSNVNAPPANVDDDHPAVVIFTSGTTGRPKGAVLSHGALREANCAISKALTGKPGPLPLTDRVTSPTLLALPIAHTGGLCSLLFALHVGRQVVLVERFRVDAVLAAIAEHSIDTMIVTPTMLQALATDEREIDLGAVRIVQSTGAPLPLSIKERFENRFDLPIIQNYGQTEALHIAGWTRDELRNGTWKAGSVGRAYEGVQLEVLNDDGIECSPREIGEICVRSDHLMSRYVGSSAEAERHIDDQARLHTGDLGYVDEEGYLFIVDRKREVIIVGGFNVYPAEVENALLDHPDVVEAVVIGESDERLGEIPHGVVVARGPGLSEAELIDHCREQIAHYKCVRKISIVDALPHTPSQKVARKQVRDMLLAGDFDCLPASSGTENIETESNGEQ